jgi:hypothetical protein
MFTSPSYTYPMTGDHLQAILLEFLSSMFLRSLVQLDAVAYCHTGYQGLLTPKGEEFRGTHTAMTVTLDIRAYKHTAMTGTLDIRARSDLNGRSLVVFQLDKSKKGYEACPVL